MATMPVRGVILDVDGTLVDSNDAHARAWTEALAAEGFAVPYDRVRRLIGTGGDKLLPAAADIEADSPKGKAVDERRGAIFRERYLPNLRPFPKAAALLKAMRARGLDLVVASSAKGEELDGLLGVVGARETLRATVSGDDADNSKPDADAVKAALDKLGYAPPETIMLGDTPYDIEAAGRVGVRTIAFRSGGWEDDDLAQALAIYDGPADLLAQLDTSPLVTGVPGNEP